MKRSSEIVLLVGPRGHDLCLCALRHPGCADFWQEVDSECIRKHHDLMRLYVFITASHAGQSLDASGLVIFGHKLRPFPYPADLVEPAAHGLSRDLKAVFVPKRRRERGTTPPSAAPAIDTWGFFE